MGNFFTRLARRQAIAASSLLVVLLLPIGAASAQNGPPAGGGGLGGQSGQGQPGGPGQGGGPNAGHGFNPGSGKNGNGPGLGQGSGQPGRGGPEVGGQGGGSGQGGGPGGPNAGQGFNPGSGKNGNGPGLGQSGKPGVEQPGQSGNMDAPEFMKERRERLQKVPEKRDDLLQRKQEMMQLGAQEKRQVKEMYPVPQQTTIENFLKELEAPQQNEFKNLSEGMPQDMRDKWASRIKSQEGQGEMKDFLKHVGNFAQGQAKEYMEGKLKLDEQRDKLQSKIEELKEKRHGLRQSLEMIERNQERFLEKQPFLAERAEEMKAKMAGLMTQLQDKGADEGQMKQALQGFKQEMMRVVKKNFDERVAKGDVPFKDTPDMEKGIDESGNEVEIKGYNPAFFGFIKKLKDRKVIGGFADGTFQPGAKVKKAELLKMALGAAGEQINFEGADPGATGDAAGLDKSPKWHRILYEKAKEAGVLEKGDKTPDKAATRAETVRYVLRSYGIPVQQGLAQKFSDVPAGSVDADAIATAQQLGIVNGVSAGQFAPNGEVSRAEMAKIIANTEAAVTKIDPTTGEIKAE